MNPPNRIVLIGAGNVAHHLGHRFQEKGIAVVQVFSRKISKARKLAKALQAEASNDLSQIEAGANLYIIAVHDDAIGPVAEQLSQAIGKQSLVVHTSGSVSSKALKPWFKNYGCFYPLQTFSINKKADFDTLPLCIYSPQKKNRLRLHSIAKIICANVYEINDQQKSTLHVAAVFVNNFTNHMYRIGQEITEEAGIDFAILKPLIQETVNKIQGHDPQAMQTGPAIRGDQMTMQNHLDFLKDNPDWAQLYALISQGIQKKF